MKLMPFGTASDVERPSVVTAGKRTLQFVLDWNTLVVLAAGRRNRQSENRHRSRKSAAPLFWPAGSEFYLRKTRGMGTSVDLGLVYDAERNLIWGIMCKLTGKGALNVLRLDDAIDLSILK